MNDDVMTPDRHGYIRVFVGGKYGQWRRLLSNDPGDDVVFLEPLGDCVDQRVHSEHPGQLSLSDDPDYSTFRLGAE